MGIRKERDGDTGPPNAIRGDPQARRWIRIGELCSALEVLNKFNKSGVKLELEGYIHSGETHKLCCPHPEWRWAFKTASEGLVEEKQRGEMTRSRRGTTRKRCFVCQIPTKPKKDLSRKVQFGCTDGWKVEYCSLFPEQEFHLYALWLLGNKVANQTVPDHYPSPAIILDRVVGCGNGAVQTARPGWSEVKESTSWSRAGFASRSHSFSFRFAWHALSYSYSAPRGRARERARDFLVIKLVPFFELGVAQSTNPGNWAIALRASWAQNSVL